MNMYRNEEKYDNIVKQLVNISVNKIRINCTRFSIEEYSYQINMLRKYYNMHNIFPEIYLDVPFPGSKIRVKYLNIYERFYINKGGIYQIEKYTGNTMENNKLYVEDKRFIHEIEVGEYILVGDGDIVFEVIDKDNISLTVIALNEGRINYMKSLYSKHHIFRKCNNFLGFKKISTFIQTLKPQGIFLSFVENCNEITEYSSRFSNLDIIPKIETPKGVSNIDDIFQKCETIMIGRGDLGNISSYDLGKNENLIIDKCKKNNKKIIVATDILSSLENQIIPKRGELLDLYYLKKMKVDGIVASASITNSKYSLEMFNNYVNNISI